MKRITLEQLGPLLREKRGNQGLREAAKAIGISPATLSRVEAGKQPDLETFSKLCKWLGVDAGEILGCSLPIGKDKSTAITEVNTSATAAIAGSSSPKQVYAHFRAQRTMTPTTVKYLSELILAAQGFLEAEGRATEGAALEDRPAT